MDTDLSLADNTIDATGFCRTGYAVHAHTEPSTIICLESCDCGQPSLLSVLFQGVLVTLTITAPDGEDPRAAPSDHPVVTLHINPGDEHHHEPCLIFDTCGPCLQDIWDTIFTNGGARIGVHPDPDEPDTVLFSDFRIENWKQTRQAITTARSRLVTGTA